MFRVKTFCNVHSSDLLQGSWWAGAWLIAGKFAPLLRCSTGSLAATSPSPASSPAHRYTRTYPCTPHQPQHTHPPIPTPPPSPAHTHAPSQPQHMYTHMHMRFWLLLLLSAAIRVLLACTWALQGSLQSGMTPHCHCQCFPHGPVMLLSGYGSQWQSLEIVCVYMYICICAGAVCVTVWVRVLRLYVCVCILLGHSSLAAPCPTSPAGASTAQQLPSPLPHFTSFLIHQPVLSSLSGGASESRRTDNLPWSGDSWVTGGLQIGFFFISMEHLEVMLSQSAWHSSKITLASSGLTSRCLKST